MTQYYSDTFAIFFDMHYTAWIRDFAPRLVKHLERIKVEDRAVLDLCCGTGEAAAVFHDHGWRVIGLDVSPGMLRVADKKLAPKIAAGGLTLMEADASAFTLPDPVNACVSTDGALNHLTSYEQMAGCFAGVSEALREGGHFVFDLLEPSHFRHWHNVMVIDEPGAMIIRRGVWDDESREGMLRISGFLGDGPEYVRLDQTLKSRSFTSSEVASAMASTDLQLLECDMLGGPCCPAEQSSFNPDPISPNRKVYHAIKRLKGDAGPGTSAVARLPSCSAVEETSGSARALR